jgi:hypothetical protein
MQIGTADQGQCYTEYEYWKQARVLHGIENAGGPGFI